MALPGVTSGQATPWVVIAITFLEGIVWALNGPVFFSVVPSLVPRAPETWDFARTNTPEADLAFKSFVIAQGGDRRIEFVNPAYGRASLVWPLAPARRRAQ